MTSDGLPTTGTLGVFLNRFPPDERPYVLASLRCTFSAVAMQALIPVAGLTTPYAVTETAVVYADQLLSKLANSTNELFTQGVQA